MQTREVAYRVVFLQPIASGISFIASVTFHAIGVNHLSETKKKSPE